MIEFKSGNIFDENVEALVNPVNCVGVMGKGLALEFKKRFPENFDAYVQACKHRTIGLGHLFVFHRPEKPGHIINFPTKQHWRDKSTIEYIMLGIIDLLGVIKHYKIGSIAIPAIGCGLGGLEWPRVKELLEIGFTTNDVRVVVFEPLTVTLPDGFGAGTVKLHTTPLKTDGRLVKLACAAPGKEYMIRWARKSDVEKALKEQSTDDYKDQL